MPRKVSGASGASMRALSRAIFTEPVVGVNAVARCSLLKPITWAKTGGSGNLTIAAAVEDTASGKITAAAVLSPGVVQTITATATGADGCVQPHSITLTGQYKDGGVTSGFLAAMGKTQADYDAVKDLGLKECAPWAIIGKAVNGPLGGEDISDAYFIKHFNAFVHVTDHKRKQIETSAGVYNWTAPRATDAKFMALVPGVKRAFHMAFGWNQYLPAHVIAGLTTGNLAADITGWLDALKAEYPNDPFYRIDFLNEPTADVDAAGNPWNVQGYQANRGMRMTGYAHQTIGTARDPADQFKWIRDAGLYARPLFPTAKSCLLENEIEVGVPPDTYNATLIPGGGNIVRTDGGRNVLMLRGQRLQYMAWDCARKGYKFDLMGFQAHISNTAPPNFEYLKSMLWNLNRWGIDPAITELNLVRMALAGSIPTSFVENTPEMDRLAAAKMLFPYIKLFGEHSAITEFTQWNGESIAPYLRQVTTESRWEFPALTAMKLALRDLKPVAERTLITGTRIWGGYSLPDWVKFVVGANTGVLTSNGFSYINGLTGTAPVMSWSWLNDYLDPEPWMSRPVSRTNFILAGQFQLTGTTNAGDKVLMGAGNSETSASPTDRVYVFGNGQTLKININAAGAGVLSATMATGLALNTLHAFAIHVNGTAVSYSVNGGAPVPLTASGPMAAALGVYLMARPTGVDSDPEKRLKWWDVYDGSQLALLGGLAALSTPKIIDVSRQYYDGK